MVAPSVACGGAFAAFGPKVELAHAVTDEPTDFYVRGAIT